MGMKKKKYIYHYFARINTTITSITIDGILTCEKKVDSMERYRDIKMAILKDTDLGITPSQLIIRSLSFLGES